MVGNPFWKGVGLVMFSSYLQRSASLFEHWVSAIMSTEAVLTASERGVIVVSFQQYMFERAWHAMNAIMHIAAPMSISVSPA